MASRPSFSPKSFLVAMVGEGRTIEGYRKDQIVISQGDAADAVFYIQKGKVMVSVVSEQRQGSRRRNAWNERFFW